VTKKVQFDFSKVDDAKRFLYNLWIGDRRIEGVQTGKGWLDFDAMTEDQLRNYASELAEVWMKPKGSKIVWRPPTVH
jgi:hypothetical protein